MRKKRYYHIAVFFALIFFALIIGSYLKTIVENDSQNCFHKKKSIKFHVDVISPEKKLFALSNNSDFVSDFKLIMNDYDFSSNLKIADYIISMEEDYPNEPIEKKAFRFVRDFTWHDNDIIERKFANSPYIMINSIGGGLCGSRSAALTNILIELGYEARSWVLGGHVVSEVLINGKWKLMDPDLGVYYFNENYEIASYAEIINNPSYITDPIKKINSDYFGFFYGYSPRLAEIYESKYDNEKLNVEYQRDMTFNGFLLPPKSCLLFPYKCNNNPSFHSIAVLKIPKSFIGKVRIPLVIAKIYGNGIIKYQNKEFTTNLGVSSEDLYGDSLSFDIDIIENQSGIKIYYYINPLIYRVRNNNKLEIYGYNIENLSFQVKQKEFDQVFVVDSVDFINYKVLNCIVDSRYNHDSIYNLITFKNQFYEILTCCSNDLFLSSIIDFDAVFYDLDSLHIEMQKTSLKKIVRLNDDKNMMMFFRYFFKEFFYDIKYNVFCNKFK